MTISMKKVTAGVLLGLGLAAAQTPAMAEDSPYTLSANVGLTSDYVFRGVSQTQNQAAIQGGFDFAHASGFYLGTWGSNVNWVEEGLYKDKSSMEIDLYGGFKGAITDSIGYDVGVVTYYYPGDKIAGATNPDTTEVYAGLSYGIFTAKVNYTVSDHFVGWTTTDGGKTQGSYYGDLSAAYEFSEGWNLLAHVGYQSVKDNDDASYTDWKIGVSKDLGFGVATLAYTDTNADKAFYTWAGDKVADGRVFVSFLKSF